MKVYEITFSPTGGTKKVTDIIMKSSEREIEEINLLPKDVDYSKYEFHKDDICIIAVPSFGGRMPLIAVDRIRMMKGNSARAVVVCVYGNRDYEDTLIELKNTAKQAGFFPVAAVAAIAEHSIMRQFAEGRPDNNDMIQIKKFGEMIWSKLESKNQLPEVTVPGNETYRAYGVIPMQPSAGKQCNGCGICVQQCPTGAIDINHPKKTDKDKCISCMRCIAVCPQKARGLSKMMLAVASKKMENHFKVRKENELFLKILP